MKAGTIERGPTEKDISRKAITPQLCRKVDATKDRTAEKKAHSSVKKPWGHDPPYSLTRLPALPPPDRTYQISQPTNQPISPTPTRASEPKPQDTHTSIPTYKPLHPKTTNLSTQNQHIRADHMESILQKTTPPPQKRELATVVQTDKHTPCFPSVYVVQWYNARLMAFTTS